MSKQPAVFSVLLFVVCLGVIGRADTIDPSQFEAPEGFEVTVWATTPQLDNPTNFDVDARGRLWVTEAVNYRNFRNESLGLRQEDGDRVVVLEDSDGDGKADASHTFVRDKDLVAPLGIGVIGNKVIVSCAPNIIIYTDVDGDTRFDPKVDTKEIFLTGFRGLDHDHSLHSVKAGPDGFWYFNVGNGGPHTVTDKSGWTLRAGSSYAGGSPHLKENFPGRKSDDGRVWVGGVGLRIRPDGTKLEPIGHNFRNAYEESISSFGDVFHADNDDPPACRTTYVMEYGNAGFSSADGTRGWMADQRPGQTVATAEWRQEDPGTMPAGDVYGYGAPTGVVFAENGCFDSRFSGGLLLTCESARGQIFAYQPKPQGAGFTLERSEFLKLKDGSAKQGWFRPSDVAIGVDGAIYVSDWYDPGVGGHRMTDATGSGTIYRIAPKGFKPSVPNLDLTTDDGQVAALLSPAVNVRALGWEALKQRGGDALPAIERVLANENPLLSARGIWLLPYAGKDGQARLKQWLKHDNAQLRIAAFRALRRHSDKPKFLDDQTLAELCADKSSAVRREVALALRDMPWHEKQVFLASIAQRFDGWDRWYLESIGIACEGHESEAYKVFVEEIGVDPLDWDRRLAGLAWRLHPVSAVDAIARRVVAESLPLNDRKRMLTALAFVQDRSAAEAMLRIAKEGPADIRGMAAWWGKNRDTNDWKEYKLGEAFPEPPKYDKPKKWGTPRLDFVLAGEPVFSGVENEIEIDVDIDGSSRLYLVVERVGGEKIEIDNSGPKPKPELLSGKAVWKNPKLIGPDSELDVSQMDWDLAFSRAQSISPEHKFDRRIRLIQPTLEDSSIHVLTRSIIAYDLTGKEYRSFHATAENVSDNKDVQIRFSVYVDRTSAGDALPPISKIAELNGDDTHGRALFFSKRLSCSNCHSASGFGGGVGPDLTEVAKKHALPVLIEGITNPSAAISTGFETMSVLTDEGRIINGLTVSAGDPVVLKDALGKHHTIPQAEIEEIRSSKISMMPELKGQLTALEIASLLAFLRKMQVN